MARLFSKGDKARVYDELRDSAGNILAAGSGHQIIGDVEVIYRSTRNGKPIFTKTHYTNDLLVTGAVFLSEKVNNVRSSFLTTPIDYSLGIHKIEEIERTSKTVPQEHIVGFCVGVGGTGGTYNTVHKVHKTDLTVPTMVPFRVVKLDRDLQAQERRRYLLRIVKGDYAYYYGKRFSVDREINVLYEDGTVVPVDVNLIGDTNKKFIKTFTKYTCTIDETDIREYFKVTEGSTQHSLVNSIGLLTGYLGRAGDSDEKKDNFDEVYNARMMTTLNTENGELKDSQSTIKYNYRLYFV